MTKLGFSIPPQPFRRSATIPLVYFITADAPHFPVKIGLSNSQVIPRRVSQLQTASPWLISPILLIEGDREIERDIHHMFRASRMRGEWFRRTLELMELVAELDAGNPDWRGLYGTDVLEPVPA